MTAGVRAGDLLAGKYRLVSLLSEGGAGSLWEAESEGDLLLVWTAPRDWITDAAAFRAAAYEDFRREPASFAPLVEAGISASAGVAWLAVRRPSGGPLNLSCSPAARAERVAEWLGDLHGKERFHGLLGPSSLWEEQGRIQTIDRAWLRAIGAGSPDRVTDDVAWLDVVCIKGGPPAMTSDVWFLGLFAFEQLAGRPFWTPGDSGESPSAPLAEILSDRYPAASSRAPAGSLPSGFDDWFFRCVNPVPSRRFPNAVAAGRALWATLAAPSTPLTPLRPRKTARKIVRPDVERVIEQRPMGNPKGSHYDSGLATGPKSPGFRPEFKPDFSPLPLLVLLVVLGASALGVLLGGGLLLLLGGLISRFVELRG